MVLYLTAVDIENQWLTSCTFYLDKINMPDRIVYDEWIKTSMLEYVFLVFSLIDMNSEASYQTQPMVKW